jgi:cell division protein ZapA
METLPKQSVVVEILGTEYRLEGEGDQDRIGEVARYVDRKMRDLALGGNPVSLGRVGVLTALNIADELFREREERRRAEEERERRMLAMQQSLEKELGS